MRCVVARRCRTSQTDHRLEQWILNLLLVTENRIEKYRCIVWIARRTHHMLVVLCHARPMSMKCNQFAPTILGSTISYYICWKMCEHSCTAYLAMHVLTCIPIEINQFIIVASSTLSKAVAIFANKFQHLTHNGIKYAVKISKARMPRSICGQFFWCKTSGLLALRRHLLPQCIALYLLSGSRSFDSQSNICVFAISFGFNETTGDCIRSRSHWYISFFAVHEWSENDQQFYK